jgi:hypothetical protein
MEAGVYNRDTSDAEIDEVIEGEIEMASDDNPVAGTESSTTTSNLVGLYSAIFTVIITFVTLSLAIIAIPNSGAGCQESCFEYPSM